jgi:hypothetical protein
VLTGHFFAIPGYFALRSIYFVSSAGRFGYFLGFVSRQSNGLGSSAFFNRE